MHCTVVHAVDVGMVYAYTYVHNQEPVTREDSENILLDADLL